MSISGMLILNQDIAPNYYDISTFGKGDVKTALVRAMERIQRKEAIKNSGKGKR